VFEGGIKKLLSVLKAGQRASCDMAEVRMIVGLGNPGTEYAGTRHNVGFDVIDSLAAQLGIEVKKKKFGAMFGQGEFDGIGLMLLKPQEYMNRSGQAVATAAGFYKLERENIVVVTDDMALEPGRIRFRKKGSSGGHNGLKDIISRLGTDEFARLRIGIGQSGREAAESYVLRRPSAEDRELIDDAAKRASQAIACWIKEGADAAMNKFNMENNVEDK
jgi:PTH1 family peptidyl-tRNA hydrolase